MNILQRSTFDLPVIIIWARKAFRWLLGSSALEKEVTFGVIKCGGIGSSMIACKNGWGLFFHDIYGEWIHTSLLTCLCMVLYSSSLLFVAFRLSERCLSSIFWKNLPLPEVIHDWFGLPHVDDPVLNGIPQLASSSLHYPTEELALSPLSIPGWVHRLHLVSKLLVSCSLCFLTTVIPLVYIFLNVCRSQWDERTSTCGKYSNDQVSESICIA